MKYVLVDKNTGYIVQSSAGARTIEFTTDVYDAALFNSAANAEKARKKMFHKDGSYKIEQWQLSAQDPGKHPDRYFVTQEAKDRRINSVPDNEKLRKYFDEVSVQGFDLEVRSVTVTVN